MLPLDSPYLGSVREAEAGDQIGIGGMNLLDKEPSAVGRGRDCCKDSGIADTAALAIESDPLQTRSGIVGEEQLVVGRAEKILVCS